MTPWRQCSQIVAAPAGWFSVHADHNPDRVDLDGTVSTLVTLRPVACFALFDRQDSNEAPFQAIVARDYYYGAIPSGFELEDEEGTFIGYLVPGGDLELFRGPVVDHYEAKRKARAA